MRSPLRNSLLLFVIVGALAVAAGGDPQDATGKSNLQVSAGEYYFNLSRKTVRRGSLTIELVNFGEDDHDLAIRRRGGGRTVTMADVKPGERGRMTTKVRRGKYSLWCTIADHKERGMKATLRVK